MRIWLGKTTRNLETNLDGAHICADPSDVQVSSVFATLRARPPHATLRWEIAQFKRVRTNIPDSRALLTNRTSGISRRGARATVATLGHRL